MQKRQDETTTFMYDEKVSEDEITANTSSIK